MENLQESPMMPYLIGKIMQNLWFPVDFPSNPLKIAIFDLWDPPRTSVPNGPKRRPEQNAVHCTIHAPWNGPLLRGSWECAKHIYAINCDMI